MRILMTGSSGPKVGAVVAAKFARHHDVFGVDLIPARHTSLVADITKIGDWSALLDGVDAVVHFAALHAPHRETHSREAFHALNVEATRTLLIASQKAGVKRFLLASSTSVYGRAMRCKTTAVWVDESLSPIAEDIYDETKLAAEALCREYFSPTLTTVSLRFSRSFPEPLPMMALYRLYRGVDARDVAQAFALALKAPMAQFEAFNISGATPFLPDDCDRLFRNAPSVLAQRAPELVADFLARGWSLPQSIDRVYAIGKARSILEYQPQYGYRDVLETAKSSFEG